jgi:hypothetical protein
MSRSRPGRPHRASSSARPEPGAGATPAGRTGVGFWLLLALALVYYALFIARTSFVIGGERYFCLFDDAMVSMRYAQHLAEGHGLVWNVGEAPVEGFSNPLWTLIMALFHKALPLATRLRSLPIQVLGALILAVHLVYVRRLAMLLSGGSRGVGLGAVALVAFYFPLVNWTLQGMEAGVLAVITTVAVWMVLSRASVARLYALLGVGTLVRMDFVVVMVVIAIVAALTDRGRRRRHLLVGLGVVAASLVVQTFARRIYFGDFLPNTYYLKLTGYPLGLRLIRGAWVLLRFLLRSNPILLLLPFALLAWPERLARSRFALPVSLLVAQCAYSVWVGGDAWENEGVCNRYVTVAMPVVLVMVSWALSSIATRLAGRRHALASSLVGALVVIMMLTDAPWRGVLLLDAPPYVTVNAGLTARGLAARQVTTDQARIAVAAAGATSYFSDRLSIDMLGKSDRHVARLPMHRAIRQNPLTYFYPGHLKWDYAYSIGELRPDVVLQLWEYPAEARPYLDPRYVRATVVGAGTRVQMALRRDSQAIRWEQAEMGAHGGP